MEYCIVILFFAAVWHFVYQAILLPTIHASLRNRLFALRDELRSYHFENSSKRFARSYSVAQDGINNAINSMEVLGLDLQLRMAHRHATDEAFRARVDERRRILRESESPEIKEIVARANDALRQIFVLNSGGWMVYVVPVAVGVVFFRKIKATTKDLFALGSVDADCLIGHPRQFATT
jgi:hypothetical protein